MKAVGRYDSALQMFVEEPREPDMRRLSFMRWLAENGRLEQDIHGPSSGEFVVLKNNDAAELPLASFMRRGREGAANFSADLGGRFIDGVQFGNHAEGSQTIRFRK